MTPKMPGDYGQLARFTSFRNYLARLRPNFWHGWNAIARYYVPMVNRWHLKTVALGPNPRGRERRAAPYLANGPCTSTLPQDTRGLVSFMA